MNKTTDSYFDGGLCGLIGTTFISILLTICTIGICYPWALCRIEKWKAKHTVIEGRRLRFTGSGMGLFGTWIKIFLLSIITFGIYGFWANIAVQKWKAKHIRFAA